jgi:hypothetical protein
MSCVCTSSVQKKQLPAAVTVSLYCRRHENRSFLLPDLSSPVFSTHLSFFLLFAGFRLSYLVFTKKETRRFHCLLHMYNDAIFGNY